MIFDIPTNIFVDVASIWFIVAGYEVLSSTHKQVTTRKSTKATGQPHPVALMILGVAFPDPEIVWWRPYLAKPS